MPYSADTCWQTENKADYGFISHLEQTIEPKRKSWFWKGYVASISIRINKIAKSRWRTIEVVIEAKDDNDDLFLSESADLLFHYLILLFKPKDSK
jgi:phosphoribosyl-ATP pyrophosphohydrolase/phosphoribosyl-AMP cyclohydrolase